VTAAGIIMTLFISMFVIIGIISSRTDRQQKLIEDEKQALQKIAKEKQKQDVLLFVSSVAALLPDSEAALHQLKSHYGWEKITDTIGLSSLHLSILRTARYDEQVTLPNMQADRYNKDERHVKNEVLNLFTPYHEIDEIAYYGVDSFAQKPTVSMLRDLVLSDYVTTSEPITKNSRDFECKITHKGIALLTLDSCFRKGGRPQIYLPLLCEEERKIMFDVMKRRIQDVENEKFGVRVKLNA
jgi:hypothetical protein